MANRPVTEYLKKGPLAASDGTGVRKVHAKHKIILNRRLGYLN